MADIFSGVKGNGWFQKWYETGSPELRSDARSLRARGYQVRVQSMGAQITEVGSMKMTLLDVRPGTSGDAYLEAL